MNKKLLIIVLSVFTLLTLNVCAAQEIDNSTDVADDLAISDEPVLEVANDTQVLQASKEDTHINVAGKTNFDVIGDSFKVKLTDSSNKAIANAKITFTVNKATFNVNTGSSGVASLKLNLNDGSYKIVSKFAGNSKYKASSLSTTIKMTNTRVVDAGLTNSEIQKVIDNAKPNNVILFKGKSYSDINLVITKSLTLISNVDTTLKSGSSSPVITIKGKGASLTTVKGFNIQGSGDGVKVDGSNYVKIIKNDISTKGNGIVSLNAKYLNITGNNINKNSKNGILITNSAYSYIFNNKITGNGLNGILVAKTDNLYVHGNTITGNKQNGFYLAKSVDGVKYAESKNIYINKNTISKNQKDGIIISNAGNNVNIKSNSIEENHENGLSLSKIGNNAIQSNVITENWGNGIQFFDDYSKPKSQDISYNAIFGNLHIDVEARDTYYEENGERLELGDNWYTDFSGVCPKIKTNNIKFTVKQIGPNKYQATFTDSNGNIATLLPDRVLTYTADNGQKISVSIKGGAGVFTVDADNGDIVKATVDNSERDNTHDLDAKSSKEINGKSPEYSYPAIPQYALYEDIGSGSGSGSGTGTGNGQGNGGNTLKGNGNSPNESNDNTGNSTHSQNMDPSNSANNQPNDVTQPESSEVTSQASASDAGQANDADSGSQQQSVVKQITIDEDEFFKVTGISFIVLLIILTIGFYYRDDINEMREKM
jgi:hypothetical protein